MSLQPFEKFELAVRLAAARFLDSDSETDPEDEGIPARRKAHSILSAGADGAQYDIKSDLDIRPRLAGLADDIRALRVGMPLRVDGTIEAAYEHLCSIATCLATGNGDGQVCGAPAGPGDLASGLLEMASLAERTVRGVLEEHVDPSYRAGPAIVYATFAKDSCNNPHGIEAWSEIDKLPRLIHLVVERGGKSPSHLLRFIYAIFHELVCHAFQNGFGATRNAHRSCFWTEGWVDTVAFDLCLDWVGSNESYFRLHGDDARSPIVAFHQARYHKGGALSENEAMLRRNARNAFRDLANILVVLNFTNDQAKSLAMNFSLIANTHPDADCARLKLLCIELNKSFTNHKVCPKPALEAAIACVRFIEHRDFPTLELETQHRILRGH